jgi:conjugal transfer pilus assembly protein TraE
MRFSIARSQLEKIFAQRNGYMMLALGSMFICLMQIIIIFFLIGREKIILVPPNIEKSFWVSAQHISPEYLSEMTTFFANLRLNITSESASIQREILLRYTDPTYYGSLKTQLVQEADKINDQHISMAFFPTADVKVNTNKLQSIIEGDLKSYVGETALPTKHVRYLTTYRYNSGRLFIKSFEEVKHD